MIEERMNMKMKIGDIIDGQWEVEKVFVESGQGQSACVFSGENPESKYVIKMLKNKENSNNVDRFMQEIKILEKLSSVEGIPKIIQVDEKSYYYVMEYIDGKSMSCAIHEKKNRKQFDKILSAIMRLLRIVDDYSNLGIIHRDIKPDNIICKNNNLDELYLIDFGIGYDVDKGEDLTNANVQLGNRFLHLPELEKGNKRDIRSDITMCVGILFFLISGISPVTLSNEKGKMPHQTERGIINMQWIGTENLKIMNRIFDKGFQYKIEERFQSISDFVFALNELNIHLVSERGNRLYFKKTDSFCMDTIRMIMEARESAALKKRKLKLYDGKVIALGKVNYEDIDDKILICLDRDNIFELIEYLSEHYICVNRWILIKKAYFEEILMKDNSKFELLGQINFQGDDIEFKNFFLQNAFHEIPVKEILEKRKTYYFDNNTIDIEQCFSKFIMKQNKEYISFDVITEKMDIFDLTNLFEQCDSYKISDDLIWIAYCLNGDIQIAKFNERKYDKQECKDLNLIKDKILDFAFWGRDLLFLLPQELVLFNLEEGVINKRYYLKLGHLFFNKVANIDYALLKSQIIILTDFLNRKVFVNLEGNKVLVRREKAWDNNKYIVSSDHKYVYKLNYSSIVRMQIDTGVETVIFDETKSRDRMVDFDKIKYINKDYFFFFEDNHDVLANKKGKIRICRIVNNEWKTVCEINERANIRYFWVYERGIIILDETNRITWWKMNI